MKKYYKTARPRNKELWFVAFRYYTIHKIQIYNLYLNVGANKMLFIEGVTTCVFLKSTKISFGQ